MSRRRKKNKKVQRCGLAECVKPLNGRGRWIEWRFGNGVTGKIQVCPSCFAKIGTWKGLS